MSGVIYPCGLDRADGGAAERLSDDQRADLGPDHRADRRADLRPDPRAMSLGPTSVHTDKVVVPAANRDEHNLRPLRCIAEFSSRFLSPRLRGGADDEGGGGGGRGRAEENDEEGAAAAAAAACLPWFATPVAIERAVRDARHATDVAGAFEEGNDTAAAAARGRRGRRGGARVRQ